MTQPPKGLLELIKSTKFSGAVKVGNWQSAYGYAHRAFGVANTTRHRFAMASGNKGMTALVIMSLAEQGRLRLDTTARSLLGDDLPLIGGRVTIAHLMSHRSGIGDYLDESTLGDIDDYPFSVPPNELTTTSAFLPLLDGHAQVFEPGTRYAYNNGGFMVLAVLAERASGEAYHELVRSRVLEPAGMNRSGFLRSDAVPADTAIGYLRNGRTNVFNLPVLGNGDGGMYTTLADMDSFWEALMAGHIVPRSTVDQMTTPLSEDKEEELRYGLGFYLDREGPGIMLTGCDAGVSFHSHHDPITGFTWTVLCNDSNGAWPLVKHLLTSPDAR